MTTMRMRDLYIKVITRLYTEKGLSVPNMYFKGIPALRELIEDVVK